MKVFDTKLKRLPAAAGEDFSDTFLQRCSFCDKHAQVTNLNYWSCMKLSKQFFCPFCLRNNFHRKINRENILVLSFRGIIGYYYYNCYIRGDNLWFSEIVDCVKQHEEVGLQNPLFHYDPATFLWFVNFGKVGDEGRKVPLAEVEQVVGGILHCFGMNECVFLGAEVTLLKKYLLAIKQFNKNRERPAEKQFLIPTLFDIIPNVNSEETRSFTRERMLLAN